MRCSSIPCPDHHIIRSAYQHFAATYYADSLPNMGDCVGAESSALFGCGLLTSYLFLFIDFYFRTYKKSPAQAKTNGTAYVYLSLI